jgi:hypothetical protein
MPPPSPSPLLTRGALLAPRVPYGWRCGPWSALLAAALATGCRNPGMTEESESGTTTPPITTVNPTESTTEDPTATPGSVTDTTPTDTTMTSPCDEGAVKCSSVDEREVCKDGAWVEENCPEGEGCDGFGDCRPCTCDESSCIDKDTINACTCFDVTAQPCEAGTACDSLGGETACHPTVCTPGEAECAGTSGYQACNAAGTAFLPQVECDAGQLCDLGDCLPACQVVEKSDSSLGCDFWAVDMANVPPRDAYVFGVALSNPSDDASVEVEIFDRNNAGKEQLVAMGIIGPRDVKIFRLSGTSNGDKGFYPGDAGFLGTGIAAGRAFRIHSDLPIVATQFNPFGGAKAFTTDASLLLPTHTLGTDYYHLAWEKGLGAGSSMVIVATADNTSVTIRSPVNTPAGLNGMPALIAGADVTLPPLKRYDYVQVSIAGQDLSAAKITANAPVAVFGGHSCGQVPSTDVDFCDHLEEQIFPIDTWGMHYVAARSPPRAAEPMVWRVVAAKDGTDLEFDPPVSIGASYDDLAAGKMIQFTSDGDFELVSTQPVLVGGYMYGCKSTMLADCPGDPSMVLAVPVEQWLSDYVFLVDVSYSNDNVKLVRSKGQQVSIGCFGAVTDWTPVTNNFESAVVNINPGDGQCQPGTNTATGAAPFSITVVGEAASTSYAYPGGLALKPINPG